VSYDRVGDVLVAQGNLPEALKSFPRRARDCGPSGEGRPRQRRLAARPVRCPTIVSGDVLVAQGNLPEALKSFRDGLAIRDRLAKADPGNAGWQFDLVISNWKLAR